MTPARLPRVLHDALARRRGEQGCIRRPEALRRGRRRNAEVGELRQQQLDRLRLRPFVNAVERLAPSPGEQPCDRLVREDHQLLHKHVPLRLGLAPRVRHAALAVELEHRLGALDSERAPSEAPLAELTRHPLGPP